MENLIKEKLRTQFIGKRIIHYASVTSTMEIAKKLALEGAEEGTVVVADEQTSGKGRLGRRWLSPKGSLALSIIFYPSLEQLPQLFMMTSLAVVRAVSQLTGLKTVIKWPNDVLINNKKVCGILIENEVEDNRVKFALAGIGVNVNVDLSSFPDISALATSLSQELGGEVSLPDFVVVLLTEVERLYVLTQAGISPYPEWKDCLETLGKRISVKIGNMIEEGKAESVAEDGSLFLRRSDGSLTKVTAGEVTVLKD